MNKTLGNIVLSVAPPSDRSATATTNTQIERGIITAVLIAATSAPRYVGKLWVEVSIVRLLDPTVVASVHLIGSYLTLNHIPSFFGEYPIRYGDGIQLMAMSDTAGITVYADIRFSKEEEPGEPK